MKIVKLFLTCILFFQLSNVFAQKQFEFCNNFIQNLSFITGTDEGIEQNLDDNFSWMQDQGYTHLRYFGIFPNGYHTFPSSTLDANGYPTDPGLETSLASVLNKADQYGITLNFDGLEIIAESNRDTTVTGYGYITEQELADIIQELMSLGVTFISEEQFGGSYLEAIQSVTSQTGAIHETTASSWWFDTIYADEQLGSVFNFYHYDQIELDSLLALTGTYPPSNLGNLHVILEGAEYYGYPTSLAVGSFGSLKTENWKNVMLFTQIQHQVDRFSVEETNTAFCIWDNDFNFMSYVGNEILSFSGQSFVDRPIVNLVYDMSSVYSGSFYPVANASIINLPAIVNTFTLLGYRVVTTNNSILQEADLYYLMLTGGANSVEIAPLPAYVDSLINSSSTVFVHPTFGIPDENDASDWTSFRDFFGLPSGDTETVIDAIPESVLFNDFNVLWGGVNLWITPLIENLPVSQINTGISSVLLSGVVGIEDVALILQVGNKYLINSNVVHFEASYIFNEILNGPLNTPAVADIAIADDMVLIFAEYNTDINIDLPWSGTSQIIRYDPFGDQIFNSVVATGGNYTETLSRGELVLLYDGTTIDISDIAFSNQITNYPNPFESLTKINFELSEPSFVKLTIHDINGRKINTLCEGYKGKGTYSITWDGRNYNKDRVAGGIYLCILQIISKQNTVINRNTKIVFLK